MAALPIPIRLYGAIVAIAVAGTASAFDEGANPVPNGSLGSGSVGTQRGDMDRHFGNEGDPGRSTVFFDLPGNPNDQAFGAMAADRDQVYLIGRAGELANGTRLGIARLRSDGILDPEFGTAGRQSMEVAWSGDSQLTFVKAAGVFGVVGPVFLRRFYVLGRLELTGTPDGDIDFVVLCLRSNGGPFEACPDFAPASNGIARVWFDLGAPTHRKDVPYDLFVDRNNQKLLLAGAAQLAGGTPAGSDWDFAVARLDLFTGVLDAGFSGDGRQTVAFDLSATPIDEALSIHVRAFDGKIVVGGRANAGLVTFRSAMAQLNPDGSLDAGFCAPAVPTCSSPMTHRSGRRLWNGDIGFPFVQVVGLTGGDVFTIADTVVVRERAESTDTGRGLVGRVAGDGGCSVCTETHLAGFERIHPVAALIDTRFVPPLFFNPGIVVAAYSRFSTSNDRYTHVYRLHADLGDDNAFTSAPPFGQQIYGFDAADGEAHVSQPSALVRDGKGRYLIAGSRRWRASTDDWDFALARLQNDVIFDHGFE